MARFRVRALVAAAALMGSAGALAGLSAAPAGALASDHVTAGTYTVYAEYGGGGYTGTATVRSNHTVTVDILGYEISGRWATSGHKIVATGSLDGINFVFKATEETNGFGTASKPGTFTEDGVKEGTWYAVLDALPG